MIQLTHLSMYYAVKCVFHLPVLLELYTYIFTVACCYLIHFIYTCMYLPSQLNTTLLYTYTTVACFPG